MQGKRGGGTYPFLDKALRETRFWEMVNKNSLESVEIVKLLNAVEKSTK